MAELSQEELEVLAYTILGEAAGEGKEGMEAVANVIFNRAESGRFPNDPVKVALQKSAKGTHQFSTWNSRGAGGNKPEKKYKKDSPEFREALEIVQAVAAGEVEDSTGGATHYYSKSMRDEPGWFKAEAPAGVVTIGNHVFGARNNQAAVDGVAGRRTPAGVAPRPVARPSNLDEIRAEDVGQGVPRPAAISPELQAIRGGGNLTTRSVTSVPVDRFGNPLSLTQQAANKEAARLRIIRQNVNDKVGAAALATPGNAASAGKERRGGNRPEDLVGAAALSTPGNAASASKQARQKSPLQVALEAEAARRAGVNSSERKIAEQRVEQQATRPKAPTQQTQAQPASFIMQPQTAAPKVSMPSGVSKTVTTVNGKPVPQSGTVQLPRNVVPASVEKLTVPPPKTPKPVTTFAPPRGVVLPAQPKYNDIPAPAGMRLVADAVETRGEPARARGTIAANRRAAATQVGPRKAVEPSLEEIVVATRPRPVVQPRTSTQVQKQARVAELRRQQINVGPNGMLYRPGGAQRVTVASQIQRAIAGEVRDGAVYGVGGTSYGTDPGQITAGLQPGDRVYDPITNTWGLKLKKLTPENNVYGGGGSSGGAPSSLTSGFSSFING